MPGMPGSTRALAPASGPVIKSNTTRPHAAHGYPNRATWATWATNNKPRVGITLHGLATSGRLAGESTTATKPGAARMHHVAGAAQHESRYPNVGPAHAGRSTGRDAGLLRCSDSVKDYERLRWPLMGTHADNLENQL